MDQISILINAILNTKQTTQETKTKLKQVEQELNRTPLQLKIEASTGVLKQQAVQVTNEYKKAFANILKEHDSIQNALAKTEFNRIKQREILEKSQASAINKNLESEYLNKQKILEIDKRITAEERKQIDQWTNKKPTISTGQTDIQARINSMVSTNYSGSSAASSANVFKNLFDDVKNGVTELSNTEKQVAKLNNVLKDTSKHTYDIGNMFEQGAKKALIWLGVMNLIYIPIRALGAAVVTMKEVETQLTSIARVMEDVNFNMQQFGASLFDVADKTGTAFKDASDIALRFAQAGYNVTDTLQLTETALMAVQTAELDATSATESLIGIMSQWQMSASEMPLLLDKCIVPYVRNNIRKPRICWKPVLQLLVPVW